MNVHRHELQSLRAAFASYLEHVSSHLSARLGGTGISQPPLTVLPLPAAFRQWFEDAERGAPWRALSASCAELFSAEGHGTSVSLWGSALRHWFRHSGVYLVLLAGTPPDRDTLVDQLVADVRGESHTTTLLALLEGVRFSKPCLEFANFSVVRPTTEELEQMLQIPVSRMFYPHAVISTDRLSDHWYLRVQVVAPRRKIGRIYLDDPFGDALRPAYSPFPASVEVALTTVILWDWQHRHLPSPADELVGNDPWRPFEIPFVIAVSDNPFERPRAGPSVDALYYEPRFDHNQAEVGERPADWYELGHAQTEAFEHFLNRLHEKLRVIRQMGDPWHFVETGLSFLTKGFLSDGLEQLLWHITALDALLGEKRPPLGDRLSRRLAAIYSDDNGLRDKVRATFTELYGFRNELVHGRAFTKMAHHGHLRSARTLARVATLRMIDILDHLAQENQAGDLTFVASREEILESLEIDPDRRLVDVLRSLRNMKTSD